MAGLARSLLVALWTACLGSLFSLRSPTVRQAQQTLDVPMPPVMTLQVAVLLIAGSCPERRA